MKKDRPKPAAQPILYRRDLPREEPVAKRLVEPTGPPVVLAEGAPGQEVVCPDGSRAFEVVHPLLDEGDTWAPLCSGFSRELGPAGSALRQRLSSRLGLEDVRPEGVIFMDLESTGLAGTPLFLIGVMTWEDGGLVVRQYFARDYSEERGVIGLFLAELAGKELLVSFNGKSFDVPYVRVRAAATGLRLESVPPHLDLLHASRRAWKHVLPDCKLQTLEARICGRVRRGDIPGADIPDAYHSFVRTSNAYQMVRVLEHNRLDMITLADLMTRLPEG